MKKIYAFIIISMMLFSALLSSIYIDTVEAITEHEILDGTTFGTVLSDSINGTSGQVTYHFDDYSPNPSFDWDNPAGVIDGSIGTYAYTDDGNKWIFLNSNNCSGEELGMITKVEWRMYGEVDNITSDYAWARGSLRYGEIWIGTIDDPNCELPYDNPGWTNYYDATTLEDAPETWTFTNIKNNLYGGFGSTWYPVHEASAIGRIHAFEIRVTYIGSPTFDVVRDVGTNTESNTVTSFNPDRNCSGNAQLEIPVSSSVQGILDVTNNSDHSEATQVNTSGELIDGTYWYDSANQFVYVQIGNTSTTDDVAWTINCSYGAVFSVVIPSYLEVGDYFHSQGFISDEDGFAISGMIAETRVLHTNGTDALIVNPKWNCTDGNYRCTFSTASLLPGIYSVSIEFTDPGSGIMFKEGSILYLSTTPGSNIYVASKLHYTFYNNNTGIGINGESFKIYSSDDGVIDSNDRIYVTDYVTYTGQTIYYRVDDYFDNQIYPATGNYSTVLITDIEQFEDVPIDWYSFSVKNMNHSIVKFELSNGSRSYTQYLYPYEPFYWDVLPGNYRIDMNYYDSETDVEVDYVSDNVSITANTYYWIRGYDLQDIVIEITNTNTTIMDQIVNVGVNINNDGATIIRQTLNMASYLSNTQSNITNQINLVWSEVNNSQTNIINQVNSVWSTVNNTDTTVINQANSVRQSITNTETNITGQLNSVWQTVNNTETEVGDQANLIIQGVNNFESNITTQVNGIWQDINNSNTTIHTQLNTIISDVSNVNSNINTQVNYIRQDITNWATYTDEYNILPGTVSHWTFDEGTGTAVNDSIGNNDGTLNDGNWTTGKYGKTIDFDGTNTDVEVTSTEELKYSGNGGHTISAWVYVDTTESDNGAIISKPWNGNGEYNYYLWWIDSTQIFRLATTGNTSKSIDSASKTRGCWYHIVGVINETHVSLYIDGTLEKSELHEITNWTPTTGDDDRELMFGNIYKNLGESFYHLDGKIDDIRFFSRDLSADEVLQLYQSSTGTSGTAYIGTQINAVDQSITNANTTIHTQINSVIQTVNNFESNITTQITTVTQQINNFESNITTQINGVTASITNSETNITTQLTVVEAMVTNTESNITTQINYVTTAITNTETNITTQVNNIHATIANTETNITNQINNIEIDITNMNTTVHNQLNTIITDISNTNTTIVNQANMIVTTITNTESNITTQLNAINTAITNSESNLTAQVNIVLTNISNVDSSIGGQLNVISAEITNVETNLTTQINTVDVIINNFESNMTTQINNVVSTVNNVDTNIINQINQVWQSVNNSNSTIHTQFNSISQQVSNTETNLTNQINAVSVTVTNTETNITNQLTIVNTTITNSNTSIMNQLNTMSTSINNAESNINSQINLIWNEINNTNSTLGTQLNSISTQITNTNTSIHSQFTSVSTQIINQETNITTQLNVISTEIANQETNITTQINAVQTIIFNTESNLSSQINSIDINITNLNVSSVISQLNSVQIQITNSETNITNQLNTVITDIVNTNSNIITQTNSILNQITNTEGNITTQITIVSTKIDNSNTTIHTQLNILSNSIINSETNITTQINDIEVDISNLNSNIDTQFNSVEVWISNHDTNLTTQVNAIMTAIQNNNTNMVDQVNLIWNEINNTNATIGVQITGINTKVSTFWSNVNTSFTVIQNKVDYSETNITNLITDMNATLLAQLTGVLDNVSEAGVSVFEQVTDVLTNLANVNTSLQDEILSNALVIMNNVTRHNYNTTLDIINNLASMNSSLVDEILNKALFIMDNVTSDNHNITVEILSKISTINTSIFNEIGLKVIEIINNVSSEHSNTILQIVENITSINTTFFSELQTQAINIMVNVTEQANQNLNTITNISNAIGVLVSGNLSAMIQEVYDNISIVLDDVNNLTINITGNLTVDLTEIFENLTSIMENLSLTNVSIGNLINVSIGNLSDVVFEMWGTQNTSFEILENRSMTVFNFYNTNQGLGLDRETLRIYVNGSRLIDNLYYCTNGSLINLTIKDYYNFTLYTNNFTINAPFTFIDLGLTFHSWLFGDKNDEYYMISLLKDGGSRWWERGIVPYGEREFMIPSGNYTLRIYDKDWVELYNDTHIINNSRVYIIEGTNLTEIISGQSVIQGQLLELSSELDYALMPDIEIFSLNPPMIFSIYDKDGMAIGGNVYKICPALIVIATTRTETTGNWINSTVMIPGNDTVKNGTITIVEDTLYISGSGSTSYINITYTDNNTLMQNTTYIPSKINLYMQNITIRASNNIHILRETTYNQVKKFYWTYNANTGKHTAAEEVINPMNVPIYDIYVYFEFSNQSTADPNTVIMGDVSNDGVISIRGEDYDVTLSGIHFYLLSIDSDTTRGFTFEYYKRFDDAYNYGEAQTSISGFVETVWNELSFNMVEVGWINNENTIFRGGLYAKLDFDDSSDIDSSSMRIWDENNNQELSSSDFIVGSGFVRIGADGLGDVNPGSGRSFSVYFLLDEYPGSDPTEIHLNTALWSWGGFAVTPFLFILLIGLVLIGYGVYDYVYKSKKRKGAIYIGVFVIFIFYILAFMGV